MRHMAMLIGARLTTRNRNMWRFAWPRCVSSQRADQAAASLSVAALSLSLSLSLSFEETVYLLDKHKEFLGVLLYCSKGTELLHTVVDWISLMQPRFSGDVLDGRN